MCTSLFSINGLPQRRWGSPSAPIHIALSPEQLVDAAMSGKVVPMDALSGASLKRSRVNGEHRLEVIGFDPRALPSWKAKGCFTEIIAYQTRLFVPVNNAREIVETLAA